MVGIVITIFITFLLVAALGTLLISQVGRFIESLPFLIEKTTGMIDHSVNWISGYFDIKPQNIHEWISKTQRDLINTGSASIGHTLTILGGVLVVLLLLPVYIFLILFYHPILIEFIHRLFGPDNYGEVSKIVTQIKTVIQQYLIGLGFEACIMAILNTSALLIIGIEHAFFLGILSALVNVIPYIGGIVGVALPMLVALATESSAWPAIYVLVVFYIIQLIDNNYVVPKIVASKVKINALFSIIVVFAGSALWGIPGMFLSIPVLAIIKLICDNIEPLKPWGFLLGDNMPPILRIKAVLKKKIPPR